MGDGPNDGRGQGLCRKPLSWKHLKGHGDRDPTKTELQGKAGNAKVKIWLDRICNSKRVWEGVLSNCGMARAPCVVTRNTVGRF